MGNREPNVALDWRAWPAVAVAPEANLAAIAAAAGQPDPEARLYAGGLLHVRGVTQAALDEALAAAGGAAAERVVLEVLPVPLRLALAETPSPIPGHPHAEAAINALVATMDRPAQIAWEYLVIAKRADLLTMAVPAGLPEEWVDAVLLKAAGKPDSGAVWGPAP